MKFTKTYIIKNKDNRRVWYKNVTKEYIQKVIKKINQNNPEVCWRIDQEFDNKSADYLDRYAIVETRSGKF